MFGRLKFLVVSSSLVKVMTTFDGNKVCVFSEIGMRLSSVPEKMAIGNVFMEPSIYVKGSILSVFIIFEIRRCFSGLLFVTKIRQIQ